MSITVLPSINDTKKKSAGGGGLSDGGVVSVRKTLSGQNYVEVGPPPGIAWSGFNSGGEPLSPISVQAINFDATVDVDVQETFVHEDGVTTTNIGTPVPVAHANAASASGFLQNGGVLSHPNKLRYQLLPSGSLSLPTGRVLLHFDVLQFDIPKDQDQT